MTSGSKLYWITLSLFCLAMFGGAVADLLRLELQVEILDRLGYPLYLLTIIGVAKVAGVIVLAIPSTLILREWAYAGFTIDLVGAAVSHAFVGDAIFPTILPLLVWVVGMASYFFRPRHAP